VICFERDDSTFMLLTEPVREPLPPDFPKEAVVQVLGFLDTSRSS
jgi:hypothetical protein